MCTCTEVSAYVSLPTKMYMRPYTGYNIHVCVWLLAVLLAFWCLDAHTVNMVHCLKSYTPLMLVRTYVCTYTSAHTVHMVHFLKSYTHLMLVHMYTHKYSCGNSYKAHHTEVHTRAMLCTTQFEMWGNAVRMYTLTLAVTWRVVQ